MTLTVVGMDPSLRNWGMAKGTFDPVTKRMHLDQSDLITTELSKDKKAKNLKDIACAEELMRRAYAFAKGADVVCIECPVGSQSAAGMLAYGVCVALIACLKCAGLNIIITTPMQGKAVVTGLTDSKANAALNITKKEVIAWVVERHPELPLPRYKRHNEMLVSMEPAEHIADGVIAIYAGTQSSQFKQLLGGMPSA